MLIRSVILFLATIISLFNPLINIQGNSGHDELEEIQIKPPDDFIVEAFPDAPYHIGDFLSFRVTYTGSEAIRGEEINLSLAASPEDVIQTVTFSNHSQEAVFYWVVDTTSYQPGWLAFHFSMPERNQEWTYGVQLLPAPPGRPSEWVTVHTACCTIHYLPGSDAEDQIGIIQQILEEQASEALDQFSSQIDPDENPLANPLPLVLIPIVVGQGGFATETAVLTYTSRNWVGIQLEMLAHHEIVHVIDRTINEGSRPSLFSEGIAVYLAGGHYRKGDALERAAALLEQDLYLPLAEFTNDFYAAQHEISYMQAAGLVAYLVEIWGWETFLNFYFNLPDEEVSDFEIISSALEAAHGMGLEDLEQDYINYLASLSPGEEVKKDVRLTVETYDLIRRYQSLVVPSANFRSAWWPPIDKMLEEDIVGDYAYREKSPLNVIIETLFLEIHQAFESGNFEQIEINLSTIKNHLDQVESDGGIPSHYDLGWFNKPLLLPGQP